MFIFLFFFFCFWHVVFIEHRRVPELYTILFSVLSADLGFEIAISASARESPIVTFEIPAFKGI